MSLQQKRNPKQPQLDLDITGIEDIECCSAIDIALGYLNNVLSAHTIQMLTGTKVVIDANLIDSGGQTYAEKKEIILDRDKNTLSLVQAEELLVSMDILDKGDWTKVLSKHKDEAWSCLTYQLVHEVGHLIDGQSKLGVAYKRLSQSQSPTKYGQMSETEAFAEAFAYWVFGKEVSQEAEVAIETALNTA